MVDPISGILGAVAGVAGNIVQGIGAARREKNARKHELAIMRMNLEERKVAAQISKEAAEAVAQYDSKKGAIRADKATYGGGFVDTIRGLVRPSLTGALVFYSVYFLPHEIAGDTILFLTTEAVTFWFGGRYMDSRRAMAS